MRRPTSSQPALLLGAIGIYLLGCIAPFGPPGPGPSPDPPPPITDGEDCSNDHDSYYLEADEGARLEGMSDSCNTMPYFSSGGGGLGQGGGGGSPTFHIEPTLVAFDGLQPTEEPSISWTVMDPSTGVVLDEQGFELYESDIDYEPDGFRVTSIFFIGAELRERNVLIEGQMDVVDTEGNVVTITPTGAAHLLR